MLRADPPEREPEIGSTNRGPWRTPVQRRRAQPGLVLDKRALAAVWRALGPEVRVLLVSGSCGRTGPGAARGAVRFGAYRRIDSRPLAHVSREPVRNVHAGGVHRPLSAGPLLGACRRALPLSNSVGQH